MGNLYRLLRSTRAATAVEYGLILALIFLAAMSTDHRGRSVHDKYVDRRIIGLKQRHVISCSKMGPGA